MSEENLPIHKKFKKAWNTLPRQSKTIYKITALIMIFVVLLIYNNMQSKPNSSLPSKVSLPSSNDNNKSETNNTNNLDHSMRTALKSSEEDLQKRSIEQNATYLPNTDNLELQTSSKIEVEPTKTVVKTSDKETSSNNVQSKSQTDVSLGRTDRNNDKNVRVVQSEEMKAKIQARLSIYQAIEQSAAQVDAGGELYVRTYDKSKETATSVNLGKTTGSVGQNATESTTNNGTDKKNALTAGDVVIVKLDNYLNSDDNGKFVRLTMLEPIEGPIIMGEYTRQGEYLSITTSTISYEGVSKPFKGILVTADERMSSGASTYTDNHTFYRWSMLIVSGALSGIGEVYLSGGGNSDRVIKENGDIYETSNKGWEDIAVGVAKGIGDRTAAIAEKQFDIPPTVIVDPQAQSIWGVLVSQTTELEGFPLIDRSKVY